MTFPIPYGGITITVERPTYDRFNDPTYTEHHIIRGCLEYPSGSEEVSGQNVGITTTRSLIVPAHSDVLATDRVVLHEANSPTPPAQDSPLRHANTYQVKGTPKDWVHPMTGWSPGMSVILENVS